VNCIPKLREPLALRRSPSVPTLTRLLRLVSVAQVREALRGFAQQLLAARGSPELLAAAADGKTLRGVHEDAQSLALLELFVHQAQVTLDQVATRYHLTEGAALQEWVTTLAAQFPGLAVLTGDALFAERSLGEAIIGQGLDYVVKLKKTNPPSTKKP
jgi:hypothetical protein